MEQTNAVQTVLPFGSVVTEAISSVFGTKSIINSKGAVVGTVIAVRGRKEIAESLKLQPKKDKDALDVAVLDASDKAFLQVKKEIAGLNGDWTLHKVANRTVGDGIRQVTMTIREVSRKAQMSDEKIAKAWFTDAQFPGMTLEEKVAKIRAMREREVAALAQSQKPIDLPSSDEPNEENTKPEPK
jgi:hypothetical protein